MISQRLNLIAAWFGALAGLTLLHHLPNEATMAAATAAILLLCLAQGGFSRQTTLCLCGGLGFACTRLTVALVS